MLANLTSQEFAAHIANHIDHHRTHSPSYYGSEYIEEDGGTAHFSVLGPDGGATVVTSTINQ